MGGIVKGEFWRKAGLFIIGHPIDEIVWITLTPALSLKGEGAC